MDNGCVGAVPMAAPARVATLRDLSSYLPPVAPPSVDTPAPPRDRMENAPEGARRYVPAGSRQKVATRGRFPRRGLMVARTTPAPDFTATLSTVTGSPHAVSQTGQGQAATFYYYDERGNQTLRDAPGTAQDRSIRYSADGKAHEIQMAGGQRVRFWYGPDGQRYKREEAGKVTLYLGGVEMVVQNGIATARRTVGGIVLQTVSGGVVQATKYLFHDHLGSLIRIADANGALAEALDYTAFGDRRSAADPNTTGSASPTTPRGFTGHEYVDGTGIIHMNGRIYDSALGRFLQPDPLIQAPDNAQSWNAYTYVFNNPLAYTDPTGMFSARQFLGFFVAVVMTIVAPQNAGVWYAMATGFASGYVATGTFKGGVIGAFAAGTTYGIANAGGLDNWQQVGLQATTGCVVESLSGGSFGHGFASAGLTASVMPQVGKIGNDLQRTTVGALVGGTLSAATGGKFVNGAVSGAIQGAMMQTSAGARTPSESSEMEDGFLDGVSEWTRGIYRKIAYPKELNDPVLLAEMRDAWADSQPANPFSRHEEGGYWGYEIDGTMGVRRWERGDLTSIKRPAMDRDGTYKGLRVRGSFHTHPTPRGYDAQGKLWSSMPSSADYFNLESRELGIIPGYSYVIDNINVISYGRANGFYIIGRREDVLGK